MVVYDTMQHPQAISQAAAEQEVILPVAVIEKLQAALAPLAM
jgi:hypothetical protein